MIADIHVQVRRRVEDRMSRHTGKRVRVSGEADRLILAIRDDMVFRPGEVAKLELRLLLEECLIELDEFEKVRA